MKAKLGYIQKYPEDGLQPEFKRSLDRWDSESNWIAIVYFEIEDSP